METQLSTFCFFLIFTLSNGLFLVGEDKRQGLIPFPRVGRNSWLQSSPYFRSITDDLDDPIGPDDLFPVRYSRSLFAPRLGRRKRSSDEPTRNEQTQRGPAYYDSDGNRMDLGDFLRRSPWAIFAYKDGIEKKMAFNPRLGRAMAPRLGRKRSDENVDEEKRSPTAFSPRLGRASFLDDSSSSSGASMSDGAASIGGGEDESPVLVSSRAFNPRLGRSKSMNALSGYTPMRGGRAFSPRLGRSDVTSANNNNNEEKEQPNP